MFNAGEKTNVKIKKVREKAQIPTYGSAFAAGADLYACLDGDISVQAGKTVMVPTGIAAEIPFGFAGLIFARSGLATKQDLAPANKVGVVDCDYRGEIMVSLHNHGLQTRIVKNGDRIAQLLIMPYITAEFEETDDISDTERGAGGFGSTGV